MQFTVYDQTVILRFYMSCKSSFHIILAIEYRFIPPKINSQKPPKFHQITNDIKQKTMQKFIITGTLANIWKNYLTNVAFKPNEVILLYVVPWDINWAKEDTVQKVVICSVNTWYMIIMSVLNANLHFCRIWKKNHLKGVWLYVTGSVSTFHIW